jgi:predicted transposase/invertase (TIGR01784 family)
MAKNDSQKQVNIHDEFFLTTFSDMNNARDLQRNIKLFTAMIALKAAYSNNFKYLLVRMFKIAIESGMLRVESSDIIFLTKYVSQALKVDEEEFWGLIEESDLNREDIMPTFVETWEQRGVERGIKQGMQQGMQQRTIDIVKQMLQKGFDISTISDVTKLSIAEIQKIKNSLN